MNLPNYANAGSMRFAIDHPFNAEIGEVISLMDEDPAVKEIVFPYEIHACRSFPGDSIPEEK